MGKILDFFTGNTAAGVVKEGLGAVGSGISNLLDRFVPRKMSESEKFQATKEMFRLEVEQGNQEIADVNKAREMYMTVLKTQKLPWIARLLNGTFTPVAGFTALGYLADKFWVQWAYNIANIFGKTFQWQFIQRDPVTDAAMTTIILFFFGYRYKKKREGITNVG